MKKSLLALAGAAFSVPAISQPPSALPPYWSPPPEQSIPAANRDGIRDAVPSAEDLLFLYGRTGRWYRVALKDPCLSVKAKQVLRYQTGPAGDLDKDGAVLVNGKRCAIQSIVDAPEGPLRRG